MAAAEANPLSAQIAAAIDEAGGWIGFEAYMALALYTPGLGYYANAGRKFGTLPASGSDFVTAPELTPLFARALARQLRQALAATGTHELWEFGAGSGALAAQLLAELGEAVARYTIVDLSGVLRERQAAHVAARVPAQAHKLHFAERLPPRIEGVIVGNEVLDAMPVALLHFDGRQWLERGVALEAGRFAWADRPTGLCPPLEGPWAPGTVTELPRQAAAFMRTLGDTLARGAAFFIDYGFPEAEYYHPQRTGGTLMCHRAHQADMDPLVDVGLKDITAHVDFTAMALAAQEAGLAVLGYTSQARFLVNCGLVDDLAQADLRERAHAQKLLTEHEMGELFKVLALGAPGCTLEPIGFAEGDRTHRL
jgi:SAM-dependent MidA family methyltransferase